MGCRRENSEHICRGDHLTFDESTPFILTATAYAAYVADLMARIARI